MLSLPLRLYARIFRIHKIKNLFTMCLRTSNGLLLCVQILCFLFTWPSTYLPFSHTHCCVTVFRWPLFSTAAWLWLKVFFHLMTSPNVLRGNWNILQSHHSNVLLWSEDGKSDVVTHFFFFLRFNFPNDWVHNGEFMENYFIWTMTSHALRIIKIFITPFVGTLISLLGINNNKAMATFLYA